MYYNECKVVDLLKEFTAHEVVELLNGNLVPYTYDENNIVIEYCFINEPDIESIKQAFIRFEQREV